MEDSLLRSREILLESIGVRRKDAVREMTISVFQEESVASFKKIYESQALRLFEGQHLVMLNEKFNIERKKNESMIKVLVTGLTPKDEAFDAEAYFFFEDLISHHNTVKIFGAIGGFIIKARLLNEYHPTFVFDEAQKPGKFALPAVTKWLQVLQEYIVKVTIFRRVLVDIESFALQENFRRDALILAGGLFAIWFTSYLVLGLLIASVVFKWHYSLRFKLLKFFRRYFEYKESQIELQRANLSVIGLKLELISDIVRKIQRTFHSSNKTYFYYIFVDRIYLKTAALLLLFSTPIRLTLSGGCVLALLAKYHMRILGYLSDRGYTAIFEDFRVRVEGWAEGLRSMFPRPHSKPIRKSILLMEIERRNFGRWMPYDLPINFQEVDNNLSADWRWVSGWKTEVSADSDTEGWRYQDKMGHYSKSHDASSAKLRRRVWKRLCERTH